MKNRMLILASLIAVTVAVGSMLFRSAAQQVGAGSARAELVGELLAGGVE